MRVYILLTQTTSTLTKVLKFCTKKPYNHASLAFDERLEYTYSFGRIRPDDPLIGGFSHERLDAGVFKEAHCQLLSIDVQPEQYHKMRKRVLDIEANQIKYKYNFIGLFGAKFDFKIEREHAYFCSQFVSIILQEVGLLPEDFPSHLVLPTDLAKHLNLQVEYQGLLSDYLKLAGSPASAERKTDVLLRRKLFTMPFRVLFVPIKVTQVGTSTIRSGRRYLTQARKYISDKVFHDQKSS